MTSIEDPLSKPEWPPIKSEDQQLFLNLLTPHANRGPSETFICGFNNTMRSIESNNEIRALFVSRSDLHPAENLPLALASAANQIPLITLPAGSSHQLNTDVIALSSDFEDTHLLNFASRIEPAKLDWVYKCAKTLKVNKKKNEKKNEEKKKTK